MLSGRAKISRVVAGGGQTGRDSGVKDGIGAELRSPKNSRFAETWKAVEPFRDQLEIIIPMSSILRPRPARKCTSY